MTFGARSSVGSPRGGPFASAVLGTALLLTTTACSQSGSAEGPDPNAPFGVTMKPTAVSIENRSGSALTNVTLTVVPYGKATFSKAIARLDRDERRDINLTDLATDDGARFNAMFTKPKSVRVVASDSTGKQHTVEVPWR